MRLPTCAIAATLTFIGALVLGLCLEHHTQWMGPIVSIGILSTGGQMGATLAMSYALDCHKEVRSPLSWLTSLPSHGTFMHPTPVTALLPQSRF